MTVTSPKVVSLTSAVKLSTVVALGLLAGCGGPDPATGGLEQKPAEAAVTEHHRRNPNPALFEKDARPYGRSMEHWLEQWVRWVYSVPADRNPFLDPTIDSNQDQSGPVFFLAPGDRTNTIPRHRAIAVTQSIVSNDYPCPDPTFQPAPGQSLYDFLMSAIKPGQDAVQTVEATLDGEVLTGLRDYRTTSDGLFSVVGDLSLQSPLDSCITGTRQPMVADAYLYLIKPLEPGRHLLTTRLVNGSGQVFARTQYLDVQ
jgi:hypothetical protein